MSSRPARVRLKRQLSGASGSSIDVHMDVCFVCKKRGYVTPALLVCVLVRQSPPSPHNDVASESCWFATEMGVIDRVTHDARASPQYGNVVRARVCVGSLHPHRVTWVV